MLFRRRSRVMIKVINNKGVAIWRQMNIQFEKKRRDGGWCWRAGGEGEEYVAILIDKV